MSDIGEKIEAPDNTDDDVRAAIEELKASGTVDSKPEAKIALDPPKDERPRDETGKFAKTEGAEGKAPRQTLSLPAKTSGAETVIPATPSPEHPQVTAPVAWSAVMKDEFGKLPSAIQSYINSREAEAHRAISAQDDERKFGRQIKDTAAPYMATIQAEGGDAAKAFAQFLNYAHIMRNGTPQQKAGALQQVIQTYNVQLGNALQPGAQQSAPTFQPEQITGLVQAEFAKQRQVQEEASLQRQITDFGKDPAYKFFDLLKPKMSELLLQEDGGAVDLPDAYQKALDFYPEIRSIASGQPPAPVEQKRITPETIAKTDAAKRAAGSITGAPGGGKFLNGAGSVGSIEDDLRAAIRDHAGRV